MPASFPTSVLNSFMGLVLRSPLHGLASNSVLLISIKGRESGKTVTAPVRYLRDGEKVTIFTRASWAEDLGGGAPVTLRIQGKDYPGFATPTTSDLKAKTNGLARYLAAAPGEARRYKVKMEKDGKPNHQQVEAAAQQNTMIRVKVKGK